MRVGLPRTETSTLIRHAGGLVGNPGAVGITDSWAAVGLTIQSTEPFAGELVGSREPEASLTRLWGEGVLSRDRSAKSLGSQTQVYYDNIITLSVSNFGGASIWHTGSATDYPVLTVHSRNLQGAAIAAGLSRVVGINGATAVTATRPIVTLGAEFAAIRIEKLTVETPDLDCSFSDGALRAGMGFNAATVIITLIALDAELERRGDDDSCEANVINNSGGGVTLRILHVSRADAAAPEARLTTDYDLAIEVDLLASARKAREAFVAALATVDFGWSSPALTIGSGTPLDWDDDGIANVYDWTPTSVTIMLGGTEIEFGVNLTLDGVDPWPVFNVWQLQAIDGMSVSDVGKMTGGLELFGDTATRLGANYRLMMDIDATPTRGWDDGKGFNPIGTLDIDLDDGDDSEEFGGEFDGGGNVVRGLRIVRDIESIGLFGVVRGGTVANLGLDDVFVSGGALHSSHSSALVGIIMGGEVRASWARGRVTGRRAVGGLVGSTRRFNGEVPNISASWFAGHIVSRGNDDNVLRPAGGLVGSPNAIEIADSWAAVGVTVINSRLSRAGELVGLAGGLSVSVSRSWGEGFLSGLTRPDPVESQVYYDNIITLIASNFGGAAIWNTGSQTDFPALAVHPRNLQGAAVAAGLSRVLGIDGATVDAALRVDNDAPLGEAFEAIRIEKASADIPDLDCDFSDGALRAQMGFNMATAIITLIASDAEFARRGDADSCEINIVNGNGGDATLRLVYASRVDPAAPEARLTTDYALTVALDSDGAARASFVRRIEADGFDWRSPDLIIGSGTTLDWDDDGVANPYDWTPTSVAITTADGTEIEVGVNLTLNGVDPWPIYNVWQLQAIDGVSVSDAGETSENFEFFGIESARLSANYRLAANIDATPTRNWQTIGFNPIGEEDNNNITDFVGSFDGERREIRGLFMNVSGANAALFDHVGAGGRVSRLGLRDMDVRARDGGDRAAGAVARLDGGTVSLVWASGTAQGALFNNAGLVGYLESGELRESWFVGDVIGGGGNGGLVGLIVAGEIADSWAMAQVRQTTDDQPNGGLIGRANGGVLTTSWSGGPVADGDNSGGIIGKPTTDDSVLAGGAIYLDSSISGESKAKANDDVAAVISAVETMVTVDSGLGAAWDYGGDTNYPFLLGFDAELQAVYFADFQTRIFPAAGGDELRAGIRTELTARENITLTLDTNGEATAAPTPIPTCEADADEVIVAKTNYNNVTIRLRSTGGSAVFTNDCKIIIAYAENSFNVSAEALIAARGTTISGWSHSFNVNLNDAFLGEIAAKNDWFSTVRIVAGVGSSIDWDGDNIANPYDWTPAPGVNLTADFTGAFGSTGNPWPIYNVWQLQAIDGVSVSDSGVMSDGFAFFGDTATRLAANYRLQMDIDATPTRAWDGGKGFNPIGLFIIDSDLNTIIENFIGVFDGGGNVVRGLRINRAGFFNGLFSYVGGSIIGLGLDDVFVGGGSGGDSGFGSGALVGRLILGGVVRESWARGEVENDIDAGGLIGAIGDAGVGAGTVSASWFAGRIATTHNNAGSGGGLAGLLRDGAVIDSWAAADIDVFSDSGVAHEIVGTYDDDDDSLTRLWGEGFLSENALRFPIPESAETQTYYSNVITLSVSNFGGEEIWDTGSAADFPVLTVHSRNLQGAAVAAGLSRVVGINGATVTVTRRLEIDDGQLGEEFEAIRIERITDDIPALDCAFSDGALRAQMGFNMATAIITLVAFDAELAQRGAADSCEIDIVKNSGGDATLRFIYASRADAAAPEARLTTDYALRITPSIPPPVIAAPAGVANAAGAVIVAADAAAGLAVATISLASGEGTFAAVTDGDLQTEGGEMAAVSLTAAATAAFASDGLTLSLELTATGGGGSDTATIRFVSAPRAIGKDELLIPVFLIQATMGAEILAGGAASISIWHNGDNSEILFARADGRKLRLR